MHTYTPVHITAGVTRTGYLTCSETLMVVFKQKAREVLA